jgi:ring-1,2-phenylacetyl-CoA epoxidase subunit PaaB
VNTYEVFLRKAGNHPFTHAGALDAPDDGMALLLAREAYARRGEGDEMWVVDRRHLLEGTEAFLAPNADRPHRRNDGSLVAARRRERRAAHR